MNHRIFGMAVCLALIAAGVAPAGPRRSRPALEATSHGGTRHTPPTCCGGPASADAGGIEQLVRLGRAGAVEYLLDYDGSPFPSTPRRGWPAPARYAGWSATPAQDELDAIRKFQRRNATVQFENLSQWWLRRMIATPRPLEEKIVLFWHGHFTSGMREVSRIPTPCSTSRTNCSVGWPSAICGRWSSASVPTPPCSVYLDNAKNLARKPNENFARELMELFTLGEGHYSEADIKETARAFTGWTIDPVDRALHLPAQSARLRRETGARPIRAAPGHRRDRHHPGRGCHGPSPGPQALDPLRGNRAEPQARACPGRHAPLAGLRPETVPPPRVHERRVLRGVGPVPACEEPHRVSRRHPAAAGGGRRRRTRRYPRPGRDGPAVVSTPQRQRLGRRTAVDQRLHPHRPLRHRPGPALRHPGPHPPRPPPCPTSTTP